MYYVVSNTESIQKVEVMPSKKFNDESLISEQEFADRTGFTIQQIRNFRRNGEIEYYQFPTRNGLPFGAIRYEIADLKKFMQKYKFLGRKPLTEDEKTKTDAA